MRYDLIYERLASRALKQGAIDLETFILQLIDSGISENRARELLLEDIENNGPIFGKFLRSLSGAATSSIGAAANTGTLLADIDDDEFLKEMTSLASMDDVIDGADPKELDEIERSIGNAMFMWVATLINTCNRCLPLHGQILTKQEWAEQGLDPSTIHDGWTSSCQCRFVPASETTRKKELAPLMREKLKSEDGKKVSKRTRRMVLQADIDKSRAAMAKAMETEEGRRTLRILGQVKG